MQELLSIVVEIVKQLFALVVTTFTLLIHYIEQIPVLWKTAVLWEQILLVVATLSLVVSVIAFIHLLFRLAHILGDNLVPLLKQLGYVILALALAMACIWAVTSF